MECAIHNIDDKRTEHGVQGFVLRGTLATGDEQVNGGHNTRLTAHYSHDTALMCVLA